MKYVLGALALLVAGLGGAAYHLHAKIAYQPPWYVQGAGTDLAVPLDEARRVFERLEGSLAREREVILTEADLRALATHAVGNVLGVEPSAVVKGMKTFVGGRDASVEMVVDFERLAGVPAGGAAGKALQDALALVPAGLLGELFVAVRVPPGPGSDLFGGNTLVSLGGMGFRASELRSALGESLARLTGELADRLATFRMELAGGQVLLRR